MKTKATPTEILIPTSTVEAVLGALRKTGDGTAKLPVISGFCCLHPIRDLDAKENYVVSTEANGEALSLRDLKIRLKELQSAGHGSKILLFSSCSGNFDEAGSIKVGPYSILINV